MKKTDTNITSKNILVLGAGELGLPVLHSLALRARDEDGAKISVLLRASAIKSTEPDKRKLITEIRNLGIEIIEGDLVNSSIDELAEIFAQYDTVIGCAGYAAGIDTPIKLARAALQARIPRYFPWQFGADFDEIGRGSPQDIFDAQIDVRELLRSQHETEWVIISTGIFMSYLFEPDFGVVDLQNDTVHALGSVDNTMTLTTPDDIGILTAEIVFFKPRICNEIVYIAGDTVTYSDVADKLQAALGRPFRRLEWSEQYLMDKLERDPNDMMNKYRAVFAQGRGVAWDKGRTFNHKHAIPVTDVSSWINTNLILNNNKSI
ncbi:MULTISPECIES: aromatic alcohol reductase [Acinetobacter calcoaceticus/baumannii complex]|uniref:aromatic alcohol reductase n=1 Tax=Acinetobacter calcoaceticus/baumannii complex TaxID=909768 RepID=UPI00238040F1|nr:aromatic alcohol reductase [Acinetobacter pittii]MDE4040211.1 aromatic alcohol reductase [Acinetobacter pittii]